MICGVSAAQLDIAAIGEIVRYFIAHLERLSRFYLLLLGFGLIAVIGFLDYATGTEISFAVLYLAPVSMLAYLVGRYSGLIAALVAVLVWLAADFYSGQVYSHVYFWVWSGIGRLTFLVIVASLLSALRGAYLHEKSLARTDHLTQAVNSRSFFETTETELTRARRYNRRLTVAYIDIDDFKAVNDKLGHGVGDELLQSMSRILRENTRGTDTVARLGGDEFAILLPETDHKAAIVVIGKIKEQLLMHAMDRALPVGFSIGVLTCDDIPRSVQEMIEIADKLMYEVKSTGKNGIKHQVLKMQYVTRPVPA